MATKITDQLLSEARTLGRECGAQARREGWGGAGEYEIVGGDWEALVALVARHGIDDLYGYSEEHRPIAGAFLDGVAESAPVPARGRPRKGTPVKTTALRVTMDDAMIDAVKVAADQTDEGNVSRWIRRAIAEKLRDE